MPCCAGSHAKNVSVCSASWFQVLHNGEGQYPRARSSETILHREGYDVSSSVVSSTSEKLLMTLMGSRTSTWSTWAASRALDQEAMSRAGQRKGQSHSGGQGSEPQHVGRQQPYAEQHSYCYSCCYCTRADRSAWLGRIRYDVGRCTTNQLRGNEARVHRRARALQRIWRRTK